MTVKSSCTPLKFLFVMGELGLPMVDLVGLHVTATPTTLTSEWTLHYACIVDTKRAQALHRDAILICDRYQCLAE
jgi:hypothetical protein